MDLTSWVETSSPSVLTMDSEKKSFKRLVPNSVCTNLLLATRDTVEISKPGDLGDIPQDHWLQLGGISCEEKFFLKLHDRIHRLLECILSLLDGINKPFGRIYFLLDKQDRLFVFFLYGMLFFFD